jgi:two-component sensor histidine kinase
LSALMDAELSAASALELQPARQALVVDVTDSEVDLAFRARALELGFWLGWLAIAAALSGLAFDTGSSQRWLVVGLTVAAAACNAAAMFVPWRQWLEDRRGRLLVDLWSGALVGFVATLVFTGGPNFALLLFLTVPFIAVVQSGWRRGLWLTVTAATCALAVTLVPLPVGATAMRLALVAAVAGATLALARTIRRETAAHRRAAARAELERTLAREANHRIKNNLQTVADLLLLGRPEDGDAQAFDDTAARIRSVATIHRLLTNGQDRVDARALLEGIAEGAPVPIAIQTDSAALDAPTAQKLGIVANELITNAFQHGEPPIEVRLHGGHRIRLDVDDRGPGPEGEEAGLGLRLVRQLVEQALGGRFELAALPGGGTRAEVVLPEQAR